MMTMMMKITTATTKQQEVKKITPMLAALQQLHQIFLCPACAYHHRSRDQYQSLLIDDWLHTMYNIKTINNMFKMAINTFKTEEKKNYCCAYSLLI